MPGLFAVLRLMMLLCRGRERRGTYVIRKSHVVSYHRSKLTLGTTPVVSHLVARSRASSSQASWEAFACSAEKHSLVHVSALLLLPCLPAPLHRHHRLALKIIAAMATLTVATICSLHLATSPTTTSCPRSKPALALAHAQPSLLNATSLRLQTALGYSKQSPQRRRWRCQAESVDAKETVAAGEQKISEVKESLTTEKQGPPVLTILAGIVVAVAVIWILWSLVSAILGLFFH